MSNSGTLVQHTKLKVNSNSLFLDNNTVQQHGGQLIKAVAEYNIPLTEWIDLSTGINPNGYPVKNIPYSSWNRLPEENDNLIAAATKYYNCQSLIAVPGSQAAIQIIPQIFSKCRVGIVQPSYFEHQKAWIAAHHELYYFDYEYDISKLITKINNQLSKLDILIIVNPNNPTGHIFSTKTLLQWQSNLTSRNAYLIIDEAFMDADINLETSCTKQNNSSLISQKQKSNLIVLRSLGKFFGLAGIRVGFVSSNNEILNTLSELLGPWSISGPSRWLATLALEDKDWQDKTRTRLKHDSLRLKYLLLNLGLKSHNSTALFQWFQISKADELHKLLKQSGILTRKFNQPHSIRVGLPKNEQQWQKLEMVLTNSLEIIKKSSQLSCSQ